MKKFLPIAAATVTLMLAFSPGLKAQTSLNAIWSGGGVSNNWGESANWVNNQNPDGGSTAIINYPSGPTKTTSNNDYGFAQFQSILFNGGAPSYTLTGNQFRYYGKIENDSSSLQTVSFSEIRLIGGNATNDNQINPVSGDLTINSPIFIDGPALNVYGDSAHTLRFNNSINNGSNNFGQFNLNGNNTVIFGAANTYAGATDINAGIIRVDVAPSGTGANSTYFLGNGGATTTAAALYLGGAGDGTAGGVTFNNVVSVNQGSNANRYLGGTNTSGTNSFNGTVTLNGDATLLARTGGTVSFNTITASSVKTTVVGDATGNNNGTISFTGTSDNLNVAAMVNSGTLLLAKTSNSGVHAVGSSLVVNSGGTLGLGGTGNDQIFDGAPMTLNGGRFNTNGLSEYSGGAAPQPGIGALTLSQSSIIDFGTGNSIVAFANSSAATWASGAILSVYNWSGTTVTGDGVDQLYFGTDNSGITQGQLDSIRFYADADHVSRDGRLYHFRGWRDCPSPRAEHLGSGNFGDRRGRFQSTAPAHFAAKARLSKPCLGPEPGICAATVRRRSFDPASRT